MFYPLILSLVFFNVRTKLFRSRRLQCTRGLYLNFYFLINSFVKLVLTFKKNFCVLLAKERKIAPDVKKFTRKDQFVRKDVRDKGRCTVLYLEKTKWDETLQSLSKDPLYWRLTPDLLVLNDDFDPSSSFVSSYDSIVRSSSKVSVKFLTVIVVDSRKFYVSCAHKQRIPKTLFDPPKIVVFKYESSRPSIFKF